MDGVTGKEMCELAARYLKDARGVDMSPDAIWNASPTGELSHVFDLYWKARMYYAMPTHDALPETAATGEVAIIRDGDQMRLMYYIHDRWVTMQTAGLESPRHDDEG